MNVKIAQLRIKKMLFAVAAASAVLLLVIVASPIFKASKAEAQLSTNARNLSGLIAVDSVTSGGGAFTSGTGTTDSLDSLIILQGLFPTSRNATTNAKDLQGLIAVDNVVGGNTGTNGSFTKGTSNLGDLLVLNNLFLDP
jgi:2-iminoacetate synthase ThiH